MAFQKKDFARHHHKLVSSEITEKIISLKHHLASVHYVRITISSMSFFFAIADLRYFSQCTVRRFFYLLDYVTSTKFFQIGDRKKKDMDPIYCTFYEFTEAE